MGDTPAYLWWRSRESVQLRQNGRDAKQKIKVKEKETPGAVGQFFVQNYATAKGQRLSPALYADVTTFRRTSLSLGWGPLNGRCSTAFSVLTGTVLFVCLFPFLEVYPQAVSPNNVATHNFSPAQEYLRGRRTPHMIGDNARSTRMSASSSPTHLQVRRSALTTSVHEATIQVDSGGPKNVASGVVSGHSPMETQRNSVSARNSTSAQYHDAEEHTVFSSLHPSIAAASAEDKQKLSVLPPGGSLAASSFDPSAMDRNTRGEMISLPYSKRVHQTKQRLQKPLQASTVRTREVHSASGALSTASSAEARQALGREGIQKFSSTSLLSTESGFNEGALHAIERPPQQNIDHDEELKSASKADIAKKQLLPRLETASLAASPSVIQTAAPQTEKLFSAAVGAGVDGSAHMRANVVSEVYHRLDPFGAESASPAAYTPALGLPPVSLSPVAQLPQAVAADQQQVLPVQEVGESVYAAATPAQTSTPPLPAAPVLPVPQQQFITTAPAPGRGAEAPQVTGTVVPLHFQHQTGAYFTPLPTAGVQNTSTTNVSGASGVSSLVGAFETPPTNEQPPTVVAAVAPTASPPSAGAPPSPLTLTAGLSSGAAPITVFSTGTSPPTPAAPAATLTTSSVPPQTAPLPSPGFALPAPAAVTFPEPAVVMPPPSVPARAPAEAAEAAAQGTTAQVAPAQAVAGQPATDVAAGVPQSKDISEVSQVGNEGKERTRSSRGAWGALLPPPSLNIGEEPTAPEAAVVREAAASSAVTPKAHTQPTCLEACDCVALILGGFTSLFICFLSVVIATLLMSRLFSKGLFSMAFFRGGANAIIGAAVLGFTIGGLTGGLVRRCWPGALYFGGGLMSFFAALVLLGKRGAGVGALGGVITGGCIGGLASAEALPITLGCIVGLLLGIVLGFAPIFRDLKMNTRYIRYGIESRQPSLQHGDTAGRGSRAEGLPTKRLSQRLFSSPSKTSSLRTSASLPAPQGSMSRRAESLPSSS